MDIPKNIPESFGWFHDTKTHRITDTRGTLDEPHGRCATMWTVLRVLIVDHLDILLELGITFRALVIVNWHKNSFMPYLMTINRS